MKKLIVVVLLSLVVPACVSAGVNLWCERARETNKLSDWIACAIVAVAMGDGEETGRGWIVQG
ncbi:MAG: hypothetical protein NTX17_01260 [Candidatus Eisenbacteria bacterium]|nr:hypothetical protein [Candidatus Eisenbacteria bacterium]